MSKYEQNVIDGQPTLDRLGKQLQIIGDRGWPELHAALAGYVRERRGRLRASRMPFGVARDLMRFADELNKLLDSLPDLVARHLPEGE
jgi:hypothetical protein